jgi:hypothetical protein
MRYTSFKFGLLALCLFIGTQPAAASIVGFPEPTVSVVEDKAIVLTTTNTFLSMSKAIRLPVFGSVNETETSFQYRLTGSEELPSIAITIADAPIVNGAYQFAPGERAQATVLIIIPVANARERAADISAALVTWPLTYLE